MTTTVRRMDHIGIVVDDIAAATAFFVELGLEPQGEATLANDSTVDRINGLDGVRADIVMLRTPDGHGCLELCRYHTPPSHGGDPSAPTNTLGFRHIAFAVEGLDDILGRLRSRGAELVGELVRYGDSYRLCYLRGPAGVIIELAEELG
jgi:catechol 2,3-dioxygenase-like lactoylglutathione lyase family enzyme